MTHFYLEIIRSKRALLFVLIALLYGTQIQLKAQDCSPDVTPPIAVCKSILNVTLSPTGLASVQAAIFDEGSSDLCCLGSLQVRREVDGPCDSDGLPDDFAGEVTFCCDDIGNDVSVVLQVSDCSGNTESCLVTVQVADKYKPDCVAPADISVLCDDFDPTLASYGTHSVTDNCCVDTVMEVVDYGLYNDVCTQGTIVRYFTAFDCNGNSSICAQNIVVAQMQDYLVRFPNDIIVPEYTLFGDYGVPSFFAETCELIGVSYEDVVFDTVPDAQQRIERTWRVINWCVYDPGLPLVEVPNPNPNVDSNHPENMPGPVVSPAGTSAPWAPTVSKINPTDPDPTDYSTFWIADNNGYEYVQIIKVIDTFFVALEGIVFSDTTASCSYDAGEPLLDSWTVKAIGLNSGMVVEAQTDVDGTYSLMLNGFDTSVEVTLVSAGNFGQNCQSTYTVSCSLGQTSTQDIPVHLENRCGLLSVDIAAPLLRRCFDNRYAVKACNLSGEMIPDAYVEVDLDNYLELQNSQIPGTLISGNTYKFDLGDLAPGDCHNFWVDVYINCDAPLGYTHCTEAHIYPFDDCRDDSNWSGADVSVSAVCDGDSVRLKITNIGTGDMAGSLDFVVVEDIIMRQSNGFQLGVLEELNLVYTASGSTWRLEAQEEPFHPFGGPQAVALEGCGGLNQPGLVNLFPLSNSNPFIGTDCQQNIGSYDPNDKQAFPIGFGTEHFLDANTDIEYMIRFQNTGTDTAFTVVVLDTLSTFLDPSSVRVGASSHYLEFTQQGNGVLRFSFPNIELPDSNVNTTASNGFLKFRVSQKPNHADGTRIENQAAIYFDFNEAVLTNTTYHTIGHPVLTVAIDDPNTSGSSLKVFPNPTMDAAVFEFETAVQAGQFELRNQLGQAVRRTNFSGDQFRFERGGLASGLYFYSIMVDQNRKYSGKVLIK